MTASQWKKGSNRKRRLECNVSVNDTNGISFVFLDLIQKWTRKTSAWITAEVLHLTSTMEIRTYVEHLVQ